MIYRGYSISLPLFSDAECDALLRAVSDSHRSRAGVRHLMSNPAIAEFAQDHRLIDLASRALDRAAIPFRATLFEKSGEKNWLIPWHQDTALPLNEKFDIKGWGPWSEKAGVRYAHAPAAALSRILALRIHLDPSTRHNGPLRVIPESHCRGVLSDEEIAEIVGTHESVECLTDRGGVIAMQPLLIHASSKANTDAPRRVLHLEYADSLELASNIRLAIA